MKTFMQQEDIEKLAKEKAAAYISVLVTGSNPLKDVENEIRELHRALITCQDMLNHPWRYLLWHIKQKIKSVKMKIYRRLHIGKVYER